MVAIRRGLVLAGVGDGLLVAGGGLPFLGAGLVRDLGFDLCAPICLRMVYQLPDGPV